MVARNIQPEPPRFVEPMSSQLHLHSWPCVGLSTRSSHADTLLHGLWSVGRYCNWLPPPGWIGVGLKYHGPEWQKLSSRFVIRRIEICMANGPG